MAQKQYLLKNLYGDQTKQELKWTRITYIPESKGQMRGKKLLIVQFYRRGSVSVS